LNPYQIDRIGVVVPVHNEAERLAHCLRALLGACVRLRRRHDAPKVRVVVVLDRCTDASAAIAQHFPAVESIQVSVASVGKARAIGAEQLLGRVPERLWLACTDADSVVPTTWLTHHLAMARAGTDLLLGTVHPARDRPDSLDPGRYAAWAASYLNRWGHPHVHGANLGIRGDVYRACGGFPPLATDEDVGLARTAAHGGFRVISSPLNPVATSARTTGRTPAGFAAFLAGLPG
jgi:glycosyltransferase involved in cell wall biosynthesis